MYESRIIIAAISAALIISGELSAQQPISDLGTLSEQKMQELSSVPDEAPIPLSSGITGAIPPSSDELAAEARRLRENNRLLGVQPLRVQPDLPKRFESPYVTLPARLQTDNACWAFGTVAVMEAAYLKASGSPDKSFRLAPQAVIDCNPYGYTEEAGGWWSYIVYSEGKGGPLASNYPYVGATQQCKPFIPPRYQVVTRELIGDGRYASVDEIKAALYEKGAVGTTICATGKFVRHRGDAVFKQFPNRSDCHNHIVTIVGWDDEREPGVGAWQIKNSWGIAWGTEGFAWVRYGENSIGYASTWVEMAPNPQLASAPAAAEVEKAKE